MKALFYMAGYHFSSNEWWRFVISVPDGPHDRYAVAKDLAAESYPELSRWSGKFLCLTPDDVFMEV